MAEKKFKTSSKTVHKTVFKKILLENYFCIHCILAIL